MTHFPHHTDSRRTSKRPLRPGHAVLPIALLLGLWFSLFAPTILVAQTATPSKPNTTDPPALIDENDASEDDPDPNLVPLDTDGPPSEAADQSTSTTSSVPRAEDLLQPNPSGNSPATARFSDAFRLS
jgi:hypothetical protein